ncbi:fasciclin domain-containing protein [Niabella aurantiaca]|uniref:fasciclin domain-containing protein n=1 Tax=Niabella aurantiaca TaxID=379900 RepID=UPI00036413FA|nr:fasciclin domain-containing protein [Niabella aurantiaca]
MKNYTFICIIASLFLAYISGAGCKKLEIKETTTNDPNVMDYLRNDSLNRFTKLISVIDKAGYETALNTYGTYTFFAPTNDAIDAYLKAHNANSIDDLPKEDLQKMLQFHLLSDPILTSSFNDGKLSSITDFGQYLVTSVVNTAGVSSYVVNRQAKITQPNIMVGNGVIHAIDHVLTPSLLTLAQLIEQDDSYSIFTQALKETGFYDTLNITKNKNGAQVWLTVLAQKDQVYIDSSIQNYAQLKAKYCNTGDPKRTDDSLHLYMAYHILPDIKYLADIVTSNSQETLVPLEVITDKFVNNKVLINDDSYTTIDGIVNEPGVELDLATSDRSATNGVLHNALGGFGIKIRKPFPVYWDLCATQPELTRLSSIYRKKTYLFDYGDSTNNTFKDVKWEKSCLKYRTGVKGYLGDYWQMGMGRSSSNTSNLGTCSGNSWIEFTTPLLVKGKYKVWFCYYTQNSTVSAVQALFDSVPLTSALIEFNKKISSVDPAQEASLAAVGWKWWAISSEKAGATAARMLGIVDVKATGRHKIRFQLVSGANADCNFDMVHFIPVDWPSQTSPRFSKTGSIEY